MASSKCRSLLSHCVAAQLWRGPGYPEHRARATVAAMATVVATATAAVTVTVEAGATVERARVVMAAAEAAAAAPLPHGPPGLSLPLTQKPSTGPLGRSGQHS